MSDPKGLDLMNRLSNCLKTILELEPDIERLELGDLLLREFGMLKSFLMKIDSVSLEESDVARIEHATESFLLELRAPLERLNESRPSDRLLQ